MIDGLVEHQGLGQSGERVLFCIDEFANLGPMDDIAKAANSIAGAGVTLMLAVQRLGDLQELYGKAWKKFISSAGIQIWFGAEDLDTRDYLEKALGQTQVSLYARSVGLTEGTSTTEALTESYSHTHSLSTGTATSQSSAESHGSGHSTSKGRAYGRSAGRNYGPHIFSCVGPTWFAAQRPQR